MKVLVKGLSLLLFTLILHGCAVYMVYSLYRTVQDINTTLTLVDSSITRIQRVLNEGQDLKRAAEDGKLITTLAEKIPSLIQQEVELATQEKIRSLSGLLKLSSMDFTKHALAENLLGATKAYNDITATYNKFTDLMDELSESMKKPGS